MGSWADMAVCEVGEDVSDAVRVHGEEVYDVEQLPSEGVELSALEGWFPSKGEMHKVWKFSNIDIGHRGCNLKRGFRPGWLRHHGMRDALDWLWRRVMQRDDYPGDILPVEFARAFTYDVLKKGNVNWQKHAKMLSSAAKETKSGVVSGVNGEPLVVSNGWLEAAEKVEQQMKEDMDEAVKKLLAAEQALAEANDVLVINRRVASLQMEKLAGIAGQLSAAVDGSEAKCNLERRLTSCRIALEEMNDNIATLEASVRVLNEDVETCRWGEDQLQNEHRAMDLQLTEIRTAANEILANGGAYCKPKPVQEKQQLATDMPSVVMHCPFCMQQFDANSFGGCFVPCGCAYHPFCLLAAFKRTNACWDGSCRGHTIEGAWFQKLWGFTPATIREAANDSGLDAAACLRVRFEKALRLGCNKRPDDETKLGKVVNSKDSAGIATPEGKKGECAAGCSAENLEPGNVQDGGNVVGKKRKLED